MLIPKLQLLSWMCQKIVLNDWITVYKQVYMSDMSHLIPSRTVLWERLCSQSRLGKGHKYSGSANTAYIWNAYVLHGWRSSFPQWQADREDKCRDYHGGKYANIWALMQTEKNTLRLSNRCLGITRTCI